MQFSCTDFFSPPPSPSIIFHWMVVVVKNLARSFYILEKADLFFSQRRPLARKSCGVIACLGVCIAKMPVDVQQSTILCAVPWSTCSPGSLALSVSMVHEYGRVF